MPIATTFFIFHATSRYSYFNLGIVSPIQNNCNMGYGFINFLNTNYLKQFYLNFNNIKWKKYRSQKV